MGTNTRGMQTRDTGCPPGKSHNVAAGTQQWRPLGAWAPSSRRRRSRRCRLAAPDSPDAAAAPAANPRWIKPGGPNGAETKSNSVGASCFKQVQREGNTVKFRWMEISKMPSKAAQLAGHWQVPRVRRPEVFGSPRIAFDASSRNLLILDNR